MNPGGWEPVTTLSVKFDSNEDVEIVSVEYVKKPSTITRQSLCVLNTLKSSTEKIPVHFKEFSDFVQKYFPSMVDEKVLKNAWSVLNRCSTLVKPAFESEIYVLDSDSDDEGNSTIKINVESKIDTEKKPKVKNGKVVKSEDGEESLGGNTVNQALQIIKNQLSPARSETNEWQKDTKEMDRLILKKLKYLKKDWKSDSETTPKNKSNKKRKSTSEDNTTEATPSSKKRKSTGGKKRSSIAPKSEEEEAEELRLDLFINKLIELTLPPVVNSV